MNNNNKKTILSEKYANEHADFEEAKQFLATKKYTTFITKYEEEYLMGINSPLLSVPIIATYDNTLLLEKYPNGVVTENFVLTPIEKFIEMKQKATRKNSQYSSSYSNEAFASFFNEYMNRFLEVSLNIEFSEEENRVLKEQVKLKNEKNVEIMIVTPIKTNNRELLKTVKGQDLYLEDLLHNVKSLEKEVKETIKENEQYIKDIPSLKFKVEEIKLEEVNTNLSIEDFEKLVNKASNMEISPITTLKIINKISDELFLECNENFDLFVQKSKEKLLPMMSKLMYLQYKVSIEHIVNKIPQEQSLSSESRKQFAQELAKIGDLTQRDILIQVISNCDKLQNIRFTNDTVDKTHKVKMN